MGDVTDYVAKIQKAASETTNATNQITASTSKAAAAVTTGTEKMSRSYREAAIATNMVAKSVAESETSFQSVSMQMTQLGIAATALGAAMSGAFGGMAKQAAMMAGQFEQTAMSFEVMLGSARDAKQVIADLTTFAAETPFEMPEVTQAARGLILFGDRGKELMKTLNTLGNAASATGSRFGEVALIFNQIRSSGRLLAQDFYQLSTRGILSMQDLADHFKVSTAEIVKMREAGKIGFKDIKAVLEGLSAEGGRFENMMERQSKTFLGLMSTLRDNIGITMTKIGQEFLPILKIIVTGITQITQVFEQLPRPIRIAIAATLALATGVGILITTFGGMVLVVAGVTAAIGAYSATVTAAAVATAAFVAKFALIAGVVTAAAMAYVQFGKGLRGSLGDYEKYNAEVERGLKLDQEWADRYTANTEKIAERINALFSPDTRRSLIKKELEDASRSVKSYEDALKGAEKQLEDVDWAFSETFGDKRVAKAAKDVEDMNNKLNMARQRVDMLNKEMAKLPEIGKKQVQFDPEATYELEKLTDELKRQTSTLGMTATQAKAYELSLRGVSSAALQAYSAQEKLNRSMTAFTGLDSKINAMLEQLTARGFELQEIQLGISVDESQLQHMRKQLKDLVADMESQTPGLGRRNAIAQELAELTKDIEHYKGSIESVQATWKDLGFPEGAAKSVEKITRDMQIAQDRVTALKKEMDGIQVPVPYGRAQHLQGLLNEIEALQKNNKEQEKYLDILKRGKELTESYTTPFQRYQKAVEDLSTMFRHGAISKEVFNKAMDDVTKALLDTEDQARKTRQEIQKFDAALAHTPESQSRIDAYYDMLQSYKDMEREVGKGMQFDPTSIRSYANELEKIRDRAKKIRPPEADTQAAIKKAQTALERNLPESAKRAPAGPFDQQFFKSEQFDSMFNGMMRLTEAITGLRIPTERLSETSTEIQNKQSLGEPATRTATSVAMMEDADKTALKTLQSIDNRLAAIQGEKRLTVGTTKLGGI